MSAPISFFPFFWNERVKKIIEKYLSKSIYVLNKSLIIPYENEKK